jgi:hypothetical protein
MNQERPRAAALLAQESHQVAFFQRLVQANSVNDALAGASNPSAPQPATAQGLHSAAW